MLHYTAIVKKSSANNAQVTEGAFSAASPNLLTDEDNEPVMVFNGERNVLADSLKPQPLILPVKGK